MMNTGGRLYSAMSAVAVALIVRPAMAQITLSGISYIQDFDGLGSGLPVGWSVRTNATVASLGTPTAFNSASTSWGAGTGEFANYASTTSNDGTAFTGAETVATQSAATNRCLGIRQTSTFGDPGAAFVLQIQDTLGLANFQLNLDFDMLSVQMRSTTWTVDYGLGDSPNNFTAVGAYSDPATFGATPRSLSFGTALDNQNQTVWVRIVALAPSSGRGSRDTIGLDNFVLTYGPYVPSTNPPSISTQPQSRTNNATTTATFSVTASGAQPLTFRWRRNDLDLSDGNKVLGSSSSMLTITNVLAADAASYTVAVTNGYGCVISSNALLAVNDPFIATQPTSRTNLAGDSAHFSVAALGTTPLRYQWRFNNADIGAATGNSLYLTNVQTVNQGNYFVAVTNAAGGLTSEAATLTLFPTPSIHLARWDFNATNSLAATAPAASSGTGAAFLVGGTSAAFSGGSMSDSAGPPGAANSGWNTTTYAPQGTSNKLRGVEFDVSTVGYQDILLTWEERHSDSASKYARLQYSADGLNFTDGSVIVMNATNNSFVFYSADLSGISAVNDNPNFAFRIVPEFEATAIGTANDNYVATVSSYTTAGTIRFDLVNVFGYTLGTVTPVPLDLKRAGNNVVLSWPNASFSLQAAPAATGLYTNVPGATSPYTNPITGRATFFRLEH